MLLGDFCLGTGAWLPRLEMRRVCGGSLTYHHAHHTPPFGPLPHLTSTLTALSGPTREGRVKAAVFFVHPSLFVFSPLHLIHAAHIFVGRLDDWLTLLIERKCQLSIRYILLFVGQGEWARLTAEDKSKGCRGDGWAVAGRGRVGTGPQNVRRVVRFT